VRKAFCTLVVSAVVVLGGYAYGQRLSRLNSWELGFSCRTPRVIEMSEADGVAVYTYVLYEVTNSTETEIDFYPTLELETEDGACARAKVYPTVFAAITEPMTHKVLRFSEITGALKPGETKSGVAIFKGADPGANKLSLYVTGLSGDFKTQDLEDGSIKAFYKTYKLVYSRPGDEFNASLDPVKLTDTEWVWR